MHTDTLALAKDRLRVPEIWRLLNLPGEAAKSCRSPFREEANPSFSVFDDGRRWKDHATGEHGDAVDFLAYARNLSLKNAIAEFKRMAGVLDAAPAAPVSSSNALPKTQSLEWSACVAAFTPDHQAKLAAWRGYSAEFVAWLQARQIIGLYDGERVAFAVHDAQGNVIACHYRRKEDASWRYFPTGTRTAPLVIGGLATAKTVFAFESQWDFCAVADKLGWEVEIPAYTAAVITRGAANGRLLAGLCATDATLYAFTQNDPPRDDGKATPAEKWLVEVAAASGCKCLHVVTPAPHKDANDWTLAGATRADIEAAIASASPVAMLTPPAAPQDVSNPLPVLPEEDEPEAAPFPVDALPPTMALLVSAVARCERVPLALPGVCALGVVSAALGAGLEVASGPNRATRGNLFLLASAESGSGKSETFRLVAAPLVEHQQRQLEVWKEKTSPQLQSEIRVLDKEIGTLEKKAAKSIDQMERARLVGELEYKLARKDDLTRKAAMPCTIAQDVTTERLAVLLRDNREIVLSASADARKLVDNLLGRYNPGKTTDESLYLSAFSGDFVRVDRQGRDAVVLNRPCLALCWFIQPDLLSTMLGEESLSASGFLPRLLLCHTHATPRRIEGEAQALSDHTRGQWAKLVTDLLTTFHDAEKPHRIAAAPEAAELLTQFHNRVVDRRAVDLADVGAFAARYAEQAWRVAVVLHAALHGAEAGGQPLTLETAQNAVQLVEWFSAAQLDILAKGRRTAAEKVETAVLELIENNRERKGLDHVTARDVHRARIVTTADAARALLGRMERECLLTGDDVRPVHGGKVTRIFRAVGGTNPVPG